LGIDIRLIAAALVQSLTSKGGDAKPMDYEKIMNDLFKELNLALKAMAKAKDVNEKEVHSRIVKNLCESLGVFFDLASEMVSFDSDDDNNEGIPF
jgi:DNA-binding Xre family transcriptional regulator